MHRLSSVWGKREHGFKPDGMGFLADESEHAVIVPSLLQPHAFSGTVV